MANWVPNAGACFSPHTIHLLFYFITQIDEKRSNTRFRVWDPEKYRLFITQNKLQQFKNIKTEKIIMTTNM